ncbi:Glycosyltransferase involved in cell wall bisynthesis [Lachnospiraceae bacterium G11]|nr:Glycosyltransferase involved in cell wall bisynthesis [Lachnospiraceae bacterium G11]
MNKKNIMLMVPMLHQGGFERVCIQTARLLENDYNIHILIFSSKNINYDVSGLNVVDINVPSKKGIVNKVINVLKRVNKAKKVKKDLEIDISYSFGSSANYVNVLSKGKEKVITGLRCQTDMEEPQEVRLFCRRSDKVISCSKEIVRQLSRDFKYDRSVCVYNPLDITSVREKGKEPIEGFPFDPSTDKIISCMARNDYIKGIWHLVKAFSLVAKEHPEARLVVVGAGNWDDYYKLADELGIIDKVYFPGVQKNPFPYVEKSYMYVLSSNHEGFPNALLEALALAKPAVAADCKTGPREILLSPEQYEEVVKESPNGESISDTIEGEYGILVPDMGEIVNLNPEEIGEEEVNLSKAIMKMLADSDIYNRYSGKASERALNYSPDAYRENLCKELNDMD